MMDKWIYCGCSDPTLPVWYEEYYNADNHTIIKRIWNDGYEENYETEEN